MILSGRILTTLVMLAVFAGMSLMALGYAPKARYLPLLVSVPGTVMCLLQLMIDIRQALQQRAEDADLQAADATDRSREVKMFIWLAVFFVAIMAFGFLYAAPVVVAAYLRLAERESWTTSLLAGIGAWLILYGVFARLLELFIFEGLVPPLVLG